MKKFTAVIFSAILFAANAWSAQAPIVPHDYSDNPVVNSVMKKLGHNRIIRNRINMSETFFPNAEGRSNTRAGDRVTVTVSNSGSTDYTLSALRFLEAETGVWRNVAARETSWKADIEPGVYTLIAVGDTGFPDYEYVLLVDEDVEITSNMNYAVDFSPCTNHIQFRTTMPDGTRGKVDLWDDFGVVEPGNSLHGYWDLEYIYASSRQTVNYGDMSGYMIDPDFILDNELAGDVWINECSDRLLLMQVRLLITKDGGVISRVTARSTDNGVKTNSGDNYVYFEEDYLTSPLRTPETCDYNSYCYFNTMNGVPVVQNEFTIDTSFGSWPNSNKLWIDSDDEAAALGYETYAVPYFAELEGPDEVGITTTMGTFGNPVNNLKEGKYHNVIHQAFGAVGDYYQLGEGGTVYGFPKNEHFSFDHSSKVHPYGASVPVCVTLSRWQPSTCDIEDRDLGNYISNSFVGRHGEVNTAFKLVQKTELKFNQKKVNTFGSSIELYLMNNNPYTAARGDWEITYDYNYGQIDGLNASNHTVVTFNDQGEDVNPPTVQMLQLVNDAGEITDRFAEGSQGTLRLAAGDFTNILNSARRDWFVPGEECEVEVECAPYGSDNWEKLAMTADETAYMGTGWGDYYEGSLKDVTAASANGWFDLKITLTDGVGNTQKQILSPAFYIESSMSEIEMISDDNADNSYYTLDGLKISAPRPGQLYIERGPDGIVRKKIGM